MKVRTVIGKEILGRGGKTRTGATATEREKEHSVLWNPDGQDPAEEVVRRRKRR